MTEDTAESNRGQGSVKWEATGDTFVVHVDTRNGAAVEPYTVRFKTLFPVDKITRYVGGDAVIEGERISAAGLTGDTTQLKGQINPAIASVTKALEKSIDAIDQAKKDADAIKDTIYALRPPELEGRMNIKDAGLGRHISISSGQQASLGDEIWRNEFWAGGYVYKANGQVQSEYILQLDERGKCYYEHGRGFKYIKA